MCKHLLHSDTRCRYSNHIVVILQQNLQQCEESTMHNESELLPVGTVVRLSGWKRYLIIIGHKTSSKRYSMQNDYLGVLYPDGATNIDESLYFSHDMIEELLESK